MNSQELTPDLDVAEAGRVMMAQQLAVILENGAVLCQGPDVTSVHEMRKAIRRTFTCFNLFHPYFNEEIVRQYKRGLRRMMRRLGRSRDLAVFRLKLNCYNETADDSLYDLDEFWREQQEKADENLTNYLASEKRQDFLAMYVDFTNTPGEGVVSILDPWAPVKIGHIAPILIYQRVAAVRAFGDNLEKVTVTQLHKLRIQFKELRYVLHFLAPILGENIESVLISLELSQDHLGDLNDAKIALELLAEVKGLGNSVAIYQSFQEKELQRLVSSYWPVWQEFDQLQWRQNLACAVAVM